MDNIIKELQEVIKESESVFTDNNICMNTRILNASYYNGRIYTLIELLKYYDIDVYCNYAKNTAFLRRQLSLFCENIYN